MTIAALIFFFYDFLKLYSIFCKEILFFGLKVLTEIDLLGVFETENLISIKKLDKNIHDRWMISYVIQSNKM